MLSTMQTPDTYVEATVFPNEDTKQILTDQSLLHYGGLKPIYGTKMDSLEQEIPEPHSKPFSQYVYDNSIRKEIVHLTDAESLNGRDTPRSESTDRPHFASPEALDYSTVGGQTKRNYFLSTIERPVSRLSTESGRVSSLMEFGELSAGRIRETAYDRLNQKNFQRTYDNSEQPQFRTWGGRTFETRSFYQTFNKPELPAQNSGFVKKPEREFQPAAKQQRTFSASSSSSTSSSDKSTVESSLSDKRKLKQSKSKSEIDVVRDQFAFLSSHIDQPRQAFSQQSYKPNYLKDESSSRQITTASVKLSQKPLNAEQLILYESSNNDNYSRKSQDKREKRRTISGFAGNPVITDGSEFYGRTRSTGGRQYVQSYTWDRSRLPPEAENLEDRPRSLSPLAVDAPYMNPRLLAELKRLETSDAKTASVQQSLAKLKQDERDMIRKREQRALLEMQRIEEQFTAQRFLKEIPQFFETSGKPIPDWQRAMMSEKQAKLAIKQEKDRILRELEDWKSDRGPNWKRQQMSHF